MGKAEGELWDDSALITAFDNAMSKYKVMHGKKHTGFTEEAKVTCSTEENVCDQADEIHEDTRHRNAEESSNVLSTAKGKTGEAENLAPVVENNFEDSHALGASINSTNCIPIQETQDGDRGYSWAQGADEYNHLLGQYCEIEEKRQKILQQLHQYGSWNYQSAEGSSYGVQYATCSTSQDPLPANQASHPTIVCSCCPYVCQSVAMPCASTGACSFLEACCHTACTGNPARTPGKSASFADGDIVKTAMRTAERAISSMKTKTATSSDIVEETEKTTENEREMIQNIGSETDLSVVLNAWYSAGFYTGKYLVEQSIAKTRHH